MDTSDHGAPPPGGLARFAAELLVEDLEASLAFWRGALGFEIAYRRPAERFVYLERPDGPQLMLSARAPQRGRNETAALERPYGRGVLFQLTVDALEPVLDAAARAGARVHEAPHEEWRRVGDRELGRREVKLLDPDGYLVLVAEDVGERPSRPGSA